MSTKEQALQSISELPDDVSWEEIQERINFMAGVRKGFEEIDAGKGIPHEEVKREFQTWNQQFEEDARSGKYDALGKEALEDLKAGRCTAL